MKRSILSILLALLLPVMVAAETRHNLWGSAVQSGAHGAGFATCFGDDSYVGDWISISTTTPTTVDLTDDCVPATAVAVVLRHRNTAVGAHHYLQARPVGSTVTDLDRTALKRLLPIGAWNSSATLQVDTFLVAVTGGKLEAWRSATGTSVTSEAVHVVGYFK